ncbi:thioredoxin [Colwellia sp. MT41]|uniref:Thioredoxin n=1 Tax=Colwellia marinimaniae TaxID=1513592 RepID=A0ABQ0MS68_9GAMM|nr:MULTISPECIES: thioredoxin TrxC [Colwellia]ALO35016.1 thioredoxin [Colwellia sp. MT41]GAW95218.1 thiol disulfide reductase thioredoxin [Colwellia marinimaniae]
MNIVCANCFTTNHIPDDKDHNKGKCGKCQQGVYSAKPVELTSNNFYAFIERNDLPVVVDFWASWCGPCQNMAPVFSKVSQDSPTLLFAKVNTEQIQQIAAKANIRSLPTLVFFHKGEEIDRISGGLNEIQMKQWLGQSLQKISK